MLNLFQRKKRWPIGLDIGTDSIKMLQLQPTPKGMGVWAAGFKRFSEAAAEDPQAHRREAAAAVRELLRAGRFCGRQVISALSCGQMTIKNIRLPNMPKDELAEAIRFEAPDRLGFDLSPDQFGYLLAGEVRTGGETAQEVILLGIPLEALEDHLALLREMRLSPVHIDAEPVALFRVFDRLLQDRSDNQLASVVVNIGCRATTMVVARAGDIVFIKSIELGGFHLSQAVAGHLGLSYAEADELRRRVRGKEGDAQRDDSVMQSILDAVRGEVEELAKEIALCLRYCTVTFRGLRPSRAILSGGEAFDRALVQLLGENLGMECVVGHPLEGIDTAGASLGGLKEGTFSEWAVCMGLALRGVESHRSEGKVDHAVHRLSA